MRYRIIMEHTREIHAASIEDAAEKAAWLVAGMIKSGTVGRTEPIVRLLRIEEGALAEPDDATIDGVALPELST